MCISGCSSPTSSTHVGVSCRNGSCQVGTPKLPTKMIRSKVVLTMLGETPKMTMHLLGRSGPASLTHQRLVVQRFTQRFALHKGQLQLRLDFFTDFRSYVFLVSIISLTFYSWTYEQGSNVIKLTSMAACTQAQASRSHSMTPNTCHRNTGVMNSASRGKQTLQHASKTRDYTCDLQH